MHHVRVKMPPCSQDDLQAILRHVFFAADVRGRWRRFAYTPAGKVVIDAILLTGTKHVSIRKAWRELELFMLPTVEGKIRDATRDAERLISEGVRTDIAVQMALVGLLPSHLAQTLDLLGVCKATASVRDIMTDIIWNAHIPPPPLQ